MRFIYLFVSALIFTGCHSSTSPVTPDKPNESTGNVPARGRDPLQIEFTVPSQEAVKKSPRMTPSAPEPRPAEAQAVVRDERGTRVPTFADVLSLQKAVMNHNASNETERQRLAVMHILAHELLAADDLLQAARAPQDPFVELASIYLTDNLGEHHEAESKLRNFLDHWRQQAGLTVAKSLLCESIRGFRRYVASPTTVLQPGSVALVYTELRNFTLKKNQDRHVLHLRYAFELLDDRGQLIPVELFQKARPEDRETRIEFNDPVQEFHENFRFPVPGNLPMGKYSYKISMEDVNSGKKTSTMVEFQIGAR